jgi:outer membrane receptor protein involved in Fe transport
MSAVRSLKGSLLLCCAVVVLPAPAVAEAVASNTTTLETVMVTGQKRTESLQEVPQSVTVLGGTQLEAQHIQSYADLASAIPNLSFTSLGAPGLSNLEIRGISSDVGTSTVAIYLDDTPVTIRNQSFYSGQSEPQLFDIKQVEVLRGPQGTLYGSSSMGGTIRFVSNPVNLYDFGGSVSTDVSGTEHGGANTSVKGVVNMPLVDGELGLRVGVAFTHNSGFVDQVDSSGKELRSNINSDEEQVVKASLLWKPSERLSITPSIFYQRTGIGDTGLVSLSAGAYKTTKLVRENGVDTLAIPSLNLQYHFDWADLVSVTSLAYRHMPRTTDGTYFNSVYIGDYVDGLGIKGLDGKLDGSKLGALPGPVNNAITNRQFTQEVRLVSAPYDPSGIPFTWIVGLYYSEANKMGKSAQYIDNFNSTVNSVYGMTAAQLLGDPIPNDLFYAFDQHTKDYEYAVFGEGNFYITPDLKFTAGLRYQHARTTNYSTQSGFFASSAKPALKVKDSDAMTPKFTLSYNVEQNLTVYASAGKGYRLGGNNPGVPAAYCAKDLATYGLTAAPKTYDPDNLWNYEIGAKGTFLDGRLSLNSSLYDIEWKHMQIDVPLNTCGFDFTGNIGSARSYGLELEAAMQISEALSAGASGNYTHATFTESVAGLGVKSGDQIPGAPRWSLNLWSEYRRAIATGMEGFLHVNWQATGESHGTFVVRNADYKRPSYNTFGARLGADFDNWEVALYGQNLLDSYKIVQRPANNYVPGGFTLRPRTIGLSASVKY